MLPLDFLREESNSVKRALDDTLRHDYAPELSAEFYGECVKRIRHIDQQIEAQVAAPQPQAIAALLSELGDISTFITLIERSRLGEFSWPFADELRRIAREFLAEPDLFGKTGYPIVHVVADGRGYRILFEDAVRSANSVRKFAIVLFPRPFKDHVLLHSIFGHELGHASLSTSVTGYALVSQLTGALSGGNLTSADSMTAWLYSSDAPQEMKHELNEYQRRYPEPFKFNDDIRLFWIHELFCDLFGLLLFGPSFLAAHKTIIGPSHPHPLKFDLLEPSHPPYAVRHRMLVQAMRVLQWHKTITVRTFDSEVHAAEFQFLDELMEDPFPPWARIVTEQEIEDSINGIRSVCSANVYHPPGSDIIISLVKRLKAALPPILDDRSAQGEPNLRKLDFRAILHAGWIFWTGLGHFSPAPQLSFRQVNQLCNQALLQQRAIDEFLSQ